MKRLFAGLAALAVLAANLCIPAFAVQSNLPALPADTCVVDDANILSDATERYLDTLSGTLQTDCKGATFAVLTVQYTGSVSTEQFATDAFNEWGVGAADEDNGVLLLLVMESPNYADGDYYMALGSGFNNTDLDKQVSMLLQTYTEPDFAAKDYDSAVTKTADAVAQTIAQMYGVSLSTGTGSTQPVPGNPGGGYYEESAGNEGSSVITLILDLIVFVLLFCLIVMPIGRGFGWGWGPFGWHWGPFGWFGAWWVGPRPWYTRRGPGPRGPHGPGGPLGGGPNHFHGGPRPPRPPRSGGGFYGGMGGGNRRPPSGGGFGGFGGGSFGGGAGRGGFGGGSRGGFGGMGGGGSFGGGGGRGR